jgi:hypothetical protein
MVFFALRQLAPSFFGRISQSGIRFEALGRRIRETQRLTTFYPLAFDPAQSCMRVPLR